MQLPFPRFRRFYEGLFVLVAVVLLLWTLPKPLREELDQGILAIVILILGEWMRQFRAWLDRDRKDGPGDGHGARRAEEEAPTAAPSEQYVELPEKE